MSYERERRCGSVEFRSRNVSSKQGLMIKDANRCWRCILDWFLYAQLLNKKFRRNTIAQKLAVLKLQNLADCLTVLIFKNI
jgi:hypothetical protein